jgi:hypothetical protein
MATSNLMMGPQQERFINMTIGGQQANNDFARMTNPDFGVPIVKSFEQKRLEEENAHLRSLVEKLSNKLKLKQEGKPEEDLEFPLDDKNLQD